MIYTIKIQKAIRFAIKTHDVYQKQKRKGKDVAYITHPLTVGLILSQAGASEDVIVAGLLHDTIEDSPKHKKVTPKMLRDRFGPIVAALVDSMTEHRKGDAWVKRKKKAIAHVRKFSRDSVLVKSADVLVNGNDLLVDHALAGDRIFKVFNAPKNKKVNILRNYINIIEALIGRWPGSPLAGDLRQLRADLKHLE